jgi:two-component system NtrC family sensor kinase
VFPRGLKTNIALYLAILLLLAMVSIDFVMVMMVQRDMIRFEITRGNLILSAIETKMNTFSRFEDNTEHSSTLDDLDRMIAEEGFSCTLILDGNNRPIYSDSRRCPFKDELESFTRQAIASGKQATRFLGTTWGVFWKQSQNLIVSSPLFREGNIIAGASIVLPLERIYKIHRRSQRTLFIYILVNTVILTFIGLYRLSMLTVKPLNRLVKRAGEYNDDDEIFFMPEKEGNEFNKLSKALNNMLKSITEDKEKLRRTVRSLEQANIDLKQAQKDIIRAEKLASVGRLSSGIAHEIGNPIGIVTGYFELLKQNDISDNERKEFIGRAESEIGRINAIIRQLLDLSRPSSEGLASVSVHDVIDDIIDVFKLQPLMSDIRLQLLLSAEKDTVVADPNQLRQVFLNLVINAADAISSADNETDGKLIVSSEVIQGDSVDSAAHPSMIKVMFIDNGPGISEERIGSVFDPFYTTKDPGKGTGLGLSVCFMIVEGMGGKIKATSKEGEGTTMAVYLPLVPLEAEEGEAD